MVLGALAWGLGGEPSTEVLQVLAGKVGAWAL